MPQRLKTVLGLTLAVIAGVAVWDAALVRSGLYARWIEPQSTAGTTRSAILVIDKTYAPGLRNVLVLGNSRIGEGFSQNLANAATTSTDLHFINGAIPGSDPRVWNYVLREVDPDSNRFAAVAMAVNFDVDEAPFSLADYPLDIAALSPLLRLGDIVDFPGSFDAPASVAQARREILFPFQPLREDLTAFLSAPSLRRHDLRYWRKHYVGDFLAYRGRPSAVPDLPVDDRTATPTDWSGVDATFKAELEGYFLRIRQPPNPIAHAANSRYYAEWLTRIASRYRAHGVAVLIFEVPRGPWHGQLKAAPAPVGATAALVDANLVEALPGDSFVGLEQPRYFFDSAHMNREGRERFSPMLARRVADVLH